MTIDIDQLRALLVKTTPGPWSLGKPYVDDEGYRESPLFASVNGTTVCPVAVCLPFPHVSGMQEANAAFVMAARTALPALLDEVERLRAALSAQPGAQSSPWQPIETAPKDDVILLFGGLKKDGKVYAPHVNVGYWTEQFGWTCLVYSHQEFAHIEPTHWMPRPAFPKQHNDGGAG